jgi:cell division protein ZapA
MTKDANFLDIHLLGKEYRVACQPDHRDALLEAAAFVDAKMRDIADKTRSNQPERLLVMTALNIAHELLGQNKQPSAMHQKNVSDEIVLDIESLRGRISYMEAELVAVLQAENAASD